MMTRLLTSFVLAAPLLFSPLAVASQASPTAPTGDLATLQGTWQLVYGERDGVRVPDAQLHATTIRFDGNRFTFPGNYGIGTSQSGTYTVDQSVTPHQMNSFEDKTGEEHLGIYRIEGDLYTVDFSRPGDPRPTEFTAPAGSGRLLQIWVRAQ